METILIYYDTKTQNVKRFIDKLQEINGNIECHNINDAEHFTRKGHLVTFTAGNGTVPVTTNYFMQRYSELVLSISVSGNRNWGNNFARCADLLHEQYGIDIALKFELSGFNQDIDEYIKFLNQIA